MIIVNLPQVAYQKLSKDYQKLSKTIKSYQVSSLEPVFGGYWHPGGDNNLRSRFREKAFVVQESGRIGKPPQGAQHLGPISGIDGGLEHCLRLRRVKGLYFQVLDIDVMAVHINLP